MKTVIFDIDGTLADNSHRQHHLKKEPPDWNAFFDAVDEDLVIGPVKDILQSLFPAEGLHRFKLMFVSGRPRKVRGMTVRWLQYNVIDLYDMFVGDDRLMADDRLICMREDGDHRPDHVVKEEILHQLKAEGHDILCVFDDRKSCVDMWRRNGLLCFQVADGDF